MTQQKILGKHLTLFQSGNGVASAVLNGKLYAIGGSYNGNRSSSMKIYDPNAASWQTGTELPEAISHATSISQNNFIYLVMAMMVHLMLILF